MRFAAWIIRGWFFIILYWLAGSFIRWAKDAAKEAAKDAEKLYKDN